MWAVVWLIAAKLHSHHPGHFRPYPLYSTNSATTPRERRRTAHAQLTALTRSWYQGVGEVPAGAAHAALCVGSLSLYFLSLLVTRRVRGARGAVHPTWGVKLNQHLKCTSKTARSPWCTHPPWHRRRAAQASVHQHGGRPLLADRSIAWAAARPRARRRRLVGSAAALCVRRLRARRMRSWMRRPGMETTV